MYQQERDQGADVDLLGLMLQKGAVGDIFKDEHRNLVLQATTQHSMRLASGWPLEGHGGRGPPQSAGCEKRRWHSKDAQIEQEEVSR